jgi:hypothetical protein
MAEAKVAETGTVAAAVEAEVAEGAGTQVLPKWHLSGSSLCDVVDRGFECDADEHPAYRSVQ